MIPTKLKLHETFQHNLYVIVVIIMIVILVVILFFVEGCFKFQL